MEGLHIDHIKAINKGGLTTPSNLQVLCATCNIKKKDK
ncbi:MAG: HNH endonuclease [Defluviitaleaceae bacterium]|nr:HNH endonuclease [Defluviitaleaceae bacterium]